MLALIAALVCSVSTFAEAAGSRRIRVDVLFRETGTSSRDAADGSGSIIITERGVSRGSLGVEAAGRTVNTRRSSGIFTIVQDGGESRLAVATRVPVREVGWFHDYATGAGYVTEHIVFDDVGTSLKVRANLLDDDRIRVSLVPSVSWFSAQRAGAIDFTDAATEIVVSPGEEVVIGGGTRELSEVTRHVLGIARASGSGESSIVLKATLQR
jgi:hypothetical protein